MWNGKSPSATFVTRSAIHNDAFTSRLFALLTAIVDNSVYLFFFRENPFFSRLFSVFHRFLLPYLTDQKKKDRVKAHRDFVTLEVSFRKLSLLFSEMLCRYPFLCACVLSFFFLFSFFLQFCFFRDQIFGWNCKDCSLKSNLRMQVA